LKSPKKLPFDGGVAAVAAGVGPFHASRERGQCGRAIPEPDCHSHESGSPVFLSAELDSRFRGNDGEGSRVFRETKLIAKNRRSYFLYFALLKQVVDPQRGELFRH
jgi:hypothetical protein